MLKRVSIILCLLAVIVAAPLILRPDDEVSAGQADRELRIITPHNETIRREFGEAFVAFWKEKTGESVYVNWLTPGGTSEIRRVLDSSFVAAQEIGKKGIGIDVFFGGGEYIFGKQARAEPPRLEKLDIFQEQASWFSQAVIPEVFTGERYYDKNQRWVGLCLSRFGICYNRDTLKRLSLPEPKRWDDLSDPKYFGMIALSDPTKSGSVAKAFEMLIQQEMQTILSEKGDSAEPKEEGWENGLILLQKIGANARYFTDSATKVPHDVAQGDAAAGMCVDFYGRTFNEMLKDEQGNSRLHWVSPEGGTSMSVDPIAVLVGAPEAELAQEFVSFCLSDHGQLLWNTQVGEVMGPQHRALRRLPVRRDLYTPERLAHFTDAEAMPYESTGGFEYQRELTGRGFSALRLVARVMLIDTHHELKEAWQALVKNDFPPDALAVFQDVSEVGYTRVVDEIPTLMKSGTAMDIVNLSNQLGESFRQKYLETVRLAQKGGKR